MARKQRTDTANGAVAAMAAATAKTITPPNHVLIRPCDVSFWDSIISARARDRWTLADLENAAVLARTKADIERMQIEVSLEQDIVENDRGVLVVNPKHTLIETLTRRSVALSRFLQIHAEATQGKSRDQVNANTAQAEAESALDELELDGLINRPH